MTATTVTTTFGRISYDLRPPVARLALNHAPLNVIDIPMMEDLAQALAEIEARPDVSVVVLSGEGRSFSAGVDVAAHTPDKVETYAAQVSRRDSGPGCEQEGDYRRRARALPGWWCGIGDGLRRCMHSRVSAMGISRDQAGLLSTGGVHRAGSAGRAEAGSGIDSDRTVD